MPQSSFWTFFYEWNVYAASSKQYGCSCSYKHSFDESLSTIYDVWCHMMISIVQLWSLGSGLYPVPIDLWGASIQGQVRDNSPSSANQMAGCYVLSYLWANQIPGYRYAAVLCFSNEYQIFNKIVKLDYEYPNNFDANGRNLVEKLLVRTSILVVLCSPRPIYCSGLHQMCQWFLATSRTLSADFLFHFSICLLSCSRY